MEGRRPAGVNLDVALDGRLPSGTAAHLRTAAAVEHDVAVTWLGGAFHQLRADELVATAAGEPIEVGGLAGTVLDPDAERHGPDNDVLVHLTRLRDGADAPAHDGPVWSAARRAAPEERAAARARAAPPALSEAAQRLEALLKARGLDPMRVGPSDAAALDELLARGRAVAVTGTREHLHADRVDELVDLGEQDPGRLARVLRCSPERAAALLATAREH